MTNPEFVRTSVNKISYSDMELKALYKECRDAFFPYARKLGLKDVDIKDIFQESFLLFYNKLRKGEITEMTSKVSTYVVGIGKYKILEYFRSKKREIQDPELIKIASEQLEASPDVNDESRVLTREQQLLKKYFGTLGKKCQEILTFFYYESLTIKEIQEIGNYNSENVVKSHKSRCLKQLRERIKSNG